MLHGQLLTAAAVVIGLLSFACGDEGSGPQSNPTTDAVGTVATEVASAVATISAGSAASRPSAVVVSPTVSPSPVALATTASPSTAATPNVASTATTAPSTASVAPPTSTPSPPPPTVTSGSSVTITVRATSANGVPAFDTDAITLRTGSVVTAVLLNDDAGVIHNLTFSAPGLPHPEGCSGPCRDTQTFTAPAPGTYFFLCTLHDMFGTLTITN